MSQIFLSDIKKKKKKNISPGNSLFEKDALWAVGAHLLIFMATDIKDRPEEERTPFETSENGNDLE